MASTDLRMAVRVSSLGLVQLDKRKLKALMRKVGAEIAADTRAILRRSSGGGRSYRGPGGLRYRSGGKGGPYQASAPGEAPVRVTGTLARSIRVRPFPSGEGVAVRETAFYALFLAAGAKGGGRLKGKRGKAAGRTIRELQARPSLTLALSRKQASLPGRIKAAVEDGVAFVRVKG